jgi:hypothetical protein
VTRYGHGCGGCEGAGEDACLGGSGHVGRLSVWVSGHGGDEVFGRVGLDALEGPGGGWIFGVVTTGRG